jgi:hypothetical protein
MSYISTQVPQLTGTTGGAESLANALGQYGQQAQNRQAAQIQAPSGANAQTQQLQQQSLAALMAQQNGTAPSAATIGMGAGLGANLGGAYAAMRGGGLAGAQGAPSGLGTANASGIGQAGTARGQEIASGINAYGQGLNAQGSFANQQMNQDQNAALAQATLDQQQLAANNQSQLGYQGMATSALLAQLNADTNTQVANIGDAAQLGVQNVQNQAAMNNALIGGAASGAGALGTMASKFGGNGGASDQNTYGSGSSNTQDGTTASYGTTDTGMSEGEENSS